MHGILGSQRVLVTQQDMLWHGVMVGSCADIYRCPLAASVLLLLPTHATKGGLRCLSC